MVLHRPLRGRGRDSRKGAHHLFRLPVLLSDVLLLEDLPPEDFDLPESEPEDLLCVEPDEPPDVELEDLLGEEL